MPSTGPVSLFYSYSHKDEFLRDKLETHLSLLKAQGVIREWHDRRIEAGTEWDRAISKNLDEAGVILLLVSADFLASRYCRDVEVARAIERHEAGTARVIPVILRPVHGWQSAPFGKLQALPKNGKPVTKWGNRDEAFADVARGIREAAISLAAKEFHERRPELNGELKDYRNSREKAGHASSGEGQEEPSPADGPPMRESWDVPRPFDDTDFVFDVPTRVIRDELLAPLPSYVANRSIDDTFELLFQDVLNLYEALSARIFENHMGLWTDAIKHIGELNANAKAEAKAEAEAKAKAEGKGKVEVKAMIEAEAKAKGKDTFESFRGKVLSRYEETKPIGRGVKVSTAWYLITGDTGAGKTTLARGLARAFNGDFVDLRLYSSESSETSLERLAEHAAGGKPDRPYGRGYRPKVLVLDALDKMIPGALHSNIVLCLRQIRALGVKYDIAIITVRSQFFKTLDDEQIQGMTRVAIQRLEWKSVLKFAADRGVSEVLAAAASDQEAIREMARNPLILGLLVRLIELGIDIKGANDYESVFSYFITPWLVRDKDDSFIPNDLRLKCMQCLALHALGTGGKPVSYSDIDSIVGAALQPLDREQSERLNTDLRVCGFLKRVDPDSFEFQHASFYEYCIARTVFEDIGRGDFLAFGVHAFTNEVINFLYEIIVKSNKTDITAELIGSRWNDEMNDTARVNLLRIYSRLEARPGGLQLEGLSLQDQVLDGIVLRGARAGNVSLKNCRLINSVISDSCFHNWKFSRCTVRDCTIRNVQFDFTLFLESDLFVDEGSDVRFRSCEFDCTRAYFVGACAATIHAGHIHKCSLQSIQGERTSIKRKSFMRFAVITETKIGPSLAGFRIEDCSIDQLTLFDLSELRKAGRPSMTRDIIRHVGKWTSDASSARDLVSPYARAELGPDDPPDFSKPLSSTQRRKVNKEAYRERDARKGH